jgi:hypothetical protein
MKRRKFGLLGAASVTALSLGAGFAKPARALTTADAEKLKTTLTPLGAERAGNADGSIPTWSGENLPLPPGGGPYGLLPDFFASDAKVVSIDASNMAQYQEKLSVGTMAMMTKYPGFRIDVYPTHRTAIATQEVYDNAYANVTRAQSAPGGARLGFTGGFGAVPFPILNQDDPLEGGAQAMWNHNSRWVGPYEQRNYANHTMINGQLVLASGFRVTGIRSYYLPGGSLENYNGFLYQARLDVWGPPETKGQSFMTYEPSNPTTNPVEIWEYLNGQGRVRKAPELQYDTPQTQTDDILNDDESYMWQGAIDQYDWKLVGKKELYIPYNNNKLFLATSEQAMKPNFVDPDLVRWELHRVWVVEATLHPGKRNVLPHRTFYIEEDTYNIALVDAYDAQGNLFHVGNCFFENRPDIPATIYGGEAVYNVQTEQYATSVVAWNESPTDQAYILTPVPPAMIQPTAMAASQQY